MKQNNIDYNRINYGFSLLKMLLAFEVVLGHFAIWDQYNPTLVWPFRELVSIAVPCFVILSFYLMCKSLLSRNEAKFKSRLVKLLIPQIGWAIIYFVILVLLNVVFHTKPVVTFIDFLWQLFTGHSRTINPSMWYQIVMIILSIVFYLIIKKLDNKKALFTLLILTLICYYLQYSGINRRLFEEMAFEIRFVLGRIAELMPFAFTGFIIKYFDIYEKLKKYRYIIMPLCVFLFLQGYSINWIEMKDFNFSGLAKLYFALCVITFAYYVPLEYLPVSIKKIILVITDYSLGIYCSHRLIETLLKTFVPNLAIQSFERCILIYILSYLLCHIIYSIPNKYFKSLVN